VTTAVPIVPVVLSVYASNPMRMSTDVGTIDTAPIPSASITHAAPVLSDCRQWLDSMPPLRLAIIEDLAVNIYTAWSSYLPASAWQGDRRSSPSDTAEMNHGADSDRLPALHGDEQAVTGARHPTSMLGRSERHHSEGQRHAS
jgi:hypothetical protein